MKIALFGLPLTGKSTVFQLLTGFDSAEIKYDSTGAPMPRLGIVNVPDERLDFLKRLYPAKKAVYPQIEYLDLVGLEFGDIKENRLLAHLRQCDVMAHIVRAFENEAVFHSAGKVDPGRDARMMEEELILSDLIVIEGRLERLEKSLMKAKNPEDELQLLVLEKIKNALDEGNPIREMELKPEEERSIRSFGFLTQKPMQVIINLDEKDIAAAGTFISEKLREFALKRKIIISHICATIEDEISRMKPEDAKLFMQEYGLTDSGSERLIGDSFRLLGLIRFLTIGSDECRSWTIPAGTKAQEAAGTIHTDMQKGFIAAQVIKFNDFKNKPDIPALKHTGQVKVEGKDYIVQDGDLIEFRFNV